MHKYAIYKFTEPDDGKGKLFRKREVLKRFEAESDAAAYKVLKKFKKTADPSCEYYYEEEFVNIVENKDGTTTTYSSSYDMFEHIMSEDCSIFRKLKSWLRRKLDRAIDMKFALQCIWHFAKTGHDYKANWDISYYMQKELVNSLRWLKENAHGISFQYLDQARLQLHKDDKKFDLAKYNEKHHDYTSEEEDLACKLRSASYDDVIECICLYNYYNNHGIAEEELVGDVKAFEAKWKHTLPIKPGTYESFDYKRLDALADKQWNKIWDWMRENGRALWD